MQTYTYGLEMQSIYDLFTFNPICGQSDVKIWMTARPTVQPCNLSSDVVEQLEGSRWHDRSMLFDTCFSVCFLPMLEQHNWEASSNTWGRNASPPCASIAWFIGGGSGRVNLLLHQPRLHQIEDRSAWSFLSVTTIGVFFFIHMT